MNSKLIGIVSDCYYSYHQHSLEPVVQLLNNQGYGVVYLIGRDLDTAASTFTEQSHTSLNLLEKCRTCEVDGFILLNSSLGQNIDEAVYEDLLTGYLHKPTVSLGNESRSFPCVVADIAPSFRELMEHMTIDSSRQRFAFVRGPVQHTHSIQREKIFREVLDQKGITIDESLFVCGDFVAEKSYREICKLLDSTPDIDAIVACNDAMARSATIAVGTWKSRSRRRHCQWI